MPARPVPVAAIAYDFDVGKKSDIRKKPGSVTDATLGKIVSTDEWNISLLANILRITK